MTDNPLDPIKTLIDRIRRETMEMGVELVGCSVIPSLDGVGPDMMQVVFALKPDSLLSPEERAAKAAKDSLDSEFDAIMSGVAESIASDSETEKIEQAKAGTMDLLKDFLDGDK